MCVCVCVCDVWCDSSAELVARKQFAERRLQMVVDSEL